MVGMAASRALLLVLGDQTAAVAAVTTPQTSDVLGQVLGCLEAFQDLQLQTHLCQQRVAQLASHAHALALQCQHHTTQHHTLVPWLKGPMSEMRAAT